jgi:hypothetical protein
MVVSLDVGISRYLFNQRFLWRKLPTINWLIAERVNTNCLIAENLRGQPSTGFSPTDKQTRGTGLSPKIINHRLSYQLAYRRTFCVFDYQPNRYMYRN